jgi:RNA polymerase sigma-70 factor (ECF subfamily)
MKSLHGAPDDKRPLLERLHSPKSSERHDAFKELVQTYQRRLYALAYELTGNHEDADDVVQETFIKAYKTLHTFNGQAQLSTWLHRIAVNTFIDMTRTARFKAAQRNVSLHSLAETRAEPLYHEHSAEEQLHAQTISDRIEAALHLLSAQQRAVFVLRYYHDESITDIAQQLHVSEGTVKTQLFRATRTLRTALADLMTEEVKENTLLNSTLSNISNNNSADNAAHSTSTKSADNDNSVRCNTTARTMIPQDSM